ncbi:uncharacterized protein LOC102720894 isoform X1 [Oryza brachyantha]|uniref:uncharacterized protein LOC102720894 isoform X1 n=1 Tax=Oryza brachyantha TaxID=4533 RepID=UPI000776541F|nr:uncharacterized protein LOC102720894 isoform X1 [Oryza brachyantha]
MPPPAAATGGVPRSEKRPRDLEEDSGAESGSGSDSDGDFVSDLREIACLLRLIKGGANKDGQKMCEQIVASVAADIQNMLEDTKLMFEIERQNFLKVLSNTSKECDSSLNKEYIKFQETYEIFCQQKDAHVQAFRDLFSKVEVEKKVLLEQYENHRKEETATLSELDNTVSEKITHAEQSLRRTEITPEEQSPWRTEVDNTFSEKLTHAEQSLGRTELDNKFSEKIAHAKQSVRRMKQDDKSFTILRKSVGSFLECGSDDDFDLNDD